MEKQPRIYLALPNMGWVHTALWSRVLQWASSGRYLWQINPKMYVKPHHRARNMLHKEFAEYDQGQPCDYVLWLDNDTIPPPNALEKMIEDDVDVVSGTVMQWKMRGPRVVAWDRVDSGYMGLPPDRTKGLQRVDVGTLACCLMKADVLRAMPPGAFFWSEIDEWHTNGPSEDTNFFGLVKDAGFEAYVDFDVPCEHVKEIGLLHVAQLIGGEA